MTVPANLFVEAPEVQDMSLIRLDNDVNTWPEEIISKLHERVPQVSGMQTMVKFMKKDEENGTATGAVIVSSAENAVMIPLIIKEFTMYPLDVMVAKGKLLPLTPDYLMQVMDKNQVFTKIEEYPSYGGLGRFEDANLWNAVYPPSLGRYAYASAGYPMLDLIAETIDGSEMKAFIQKNPTVLAGFHKHGHADVIKKVANMQPVNMNEFSQSAEKLIPKTVVMAAREGGGKYSLLASSDQVFSPAIEVCSREEMKHKMSTISDCVSDDINEVDQNGEKFLRLPEGGEGVFLARTDTEIPEEALEFDHYSVKSKTGVSVEGVVVPKVIDFNQKAVNLKLFLGKTNSTAQQSIWGVRIKNSRFKPHSCAPKVGQTGTFLFMADKSHAIATIPVTIRTVVDDCGMVRIKAADLLGKPYHLAVATKMGLKRIGLLPTGEYLVPKEMKWVPMEGFNEVSNSALGYSVKTAGAKLTDSPVKLAHTGYDHFALRGVDKYVKTAGWDSTNLKGYQARFLLASLGCGQDKIAAAIKTAKIKGMAELHGLNFIPTWSEKLAKDYAPKLQAGVKLAAKLKRNFIKEASAIDSAQTVDALLSLNFVTPENINKFVGKIPHFKATISNLASALIASRLGMTDIPEEASSVAMHKLIEVVDGLERLRSAQQVGVPK